MNQGLNKYSTEAALARELGVPTSHIGIVGSTLICGSGNDVDLLCLLPDEDRLADLGFIPDIEASYESPLRSYRRDGQNIIATTDPRFFFAEIAIAHAAKAVASENFNMSIREDRIRFHGEVRNHVLARLHDDGEPF